LRNSSKNDSNPDLIQVKSKHRLKPCHLLENLVIMVLFKW